MRRLTALVMGNAAYPGTGKLKNPTNDADDMSVSLEALGFSVVKAIDCTYKEMDTALKQFKKNLKTNDVGLFFFAGHGMQIKGENYLIGLDTDTGDEGNVKYTALPLNRVIEDLEGSQNSTSIIILDACRNNPYEQAWHRSLAARGLAAVYAPKGTLIAFATSPGQVARDGAKRNGAYTDALLKHIHTPDCSIENMFKRVRNTLSAATKEKQISWEHTSLSSEFFFNLSIGTRINLYSPKALHDSLFVLDDSKYSHQLIRDLKSLTWPVQNPAIDNFSSSKAKNIGIDSLFLIGRNIYQSAVGNSKSAASYIKHFLSRTEGIGDEKRRAILDGMLFEIFFDSNSKIRNIPKDRFFEEVFKLQEYSELSDSFDFIAECLITYGEKFHLIPGKKHTVAVNVNTRKKKGQTDIVESVYFGASDILWLEDEHLADKKGRPLRYETMSRVNFENLLSKEMLVPSHLLTVTYTSEKNGPSQVQFPRGWTTRKK